MESALILAMRTELREEEAELNTAAEVEVAGVRTGGRCVSGLSGWVKVSAASQRELECDEKVT